MKTTNYKIGDIYLFDGYFMYEGEKVTYRHFEEIIAIDGNKVTFLRHGTTHEFFDENMDKLLADVKEDESSVYDILTRYKNFQKFGEIVLPQTYSTDHGFIDENGELHMTRTGKEIVEKYE